MATATYRFIVPGRYIGQTVTVFDQATNVQVASGTVGSDGSYAVALTQGDYYATTPDGRYVDADASGAASSDAANTSSAALSSAFAPQQSGRPPSGAVVALGDSITAWNGNGSSLRQRETWFQQLCVRSKQRIRYGGVYATAGYTLTQIRDTLLPQVLAMTPRPSACIVEGVVNDMASNFNQNTSFAVLNDICTSLAKAGIKPVLWVMPPRGDTANPDVSRWNTRLRRYADSIGALTLDAHTALTSSADGTRNTAAYVAADNVHPDWPGHTLIAQRGITDGLDQMFPAQRPTSKTSADATNLIAAGLFAADANADGLADGWASPGASVTKTLVAPTVGDDIVGKWQQFVRATGGSVSTVLQPTSDISTGFTVGDKLAFSGRFQTSGIAGSGSVYTMQVAWQGVATQNLEVLYNWDIDIADGTFYGEATVPAGTTALRPQVIMGVPTSGTPTLRVAELTLRNLTTSGVTA